MKPEKMLKLFSGAVPVAPVAVIFNLHSHQRDLRSSVETLRHSDDLCRPVKHPISFSEPALIAIEVGHFCQSRNELCAVIAEFRFQLSQGHKAALQPTVGFGQALSQAGRTQKEHQKQTAACSCTFHKLQSLCIDCRSVPAPFVPQADG